MDVASFTREYVRLRVKDVDFGYARITVRDGKGAKHRVTMLPVNLSHPLQRHLQKVKAQHEEDLEAGFGQVYLPDALARKYEWLRHSHRAGVVRAQGREHDDDLHARAEPAGPRRKKSAG